MKKPLSDYQVAHVVLLVNSFHSLEGSDYADHPVIKKAMSIANQKIIQITGKDALCFSGHMDTLINQLKTLQK